MNSISTTTAGDVVVAAISTISDSELHLFSDLFRHPRVRQAKTAAMSTLAGSGLSDLWLLDRAAIRDYIMQRPAAFDARHALRLAALGLLLRDQLSDEMFDALVWPLETVMGGEVTR